MNINELQAKWDELSTEWWEFSYENAKDFLKPKTLLGRIFAFFLSRIEPETLLGSKESMKQAYFMGGTDTLAMLKKEEPYTPTLIKEWREENDKAN